MKVRVLSHRPHEPLLQSGVVYDLHDGAHLVNAGEAEKVDAAHKAEPDPRPKPEGDGEVEKAPRAPKAKPAAKTAAKPAAKIATRKAAVRKR